MHLGDDLVFVVDVDVAWTTGFLSRCRRNARLGESIYYPILFSLYNPAVVYGVSGEEGGEKEGKKEGEKEGEKEGKME